MQLVLNLGTIENISWNLELNPSIDLGVVVQIITHPVYLPQSQFSDSLIKQLASFLMKQLNIRPFDQGEK